MLLQVLTLSDICQMAHHFRPISYDLHNLPDIGAVAPGRAGVQVAPVQAVFWAVLASGHSVLVPGAAVQVGKQFHLKRQGRAAVVIEHQEPGDQVPEVYLGF